MVYDFDEIHFRKNTLSLKWNPELYSARFNGHKDLLPLWVADMDFTVSKGIQKRVKLVTDNGIFGYTGFDQEYYNAIISWNKRRYGIDIEQNEIIHVSSIVPALCYLIQTFTQKGDAIIIQPPVYYPIKNSIIDNDRTLVCSPLVEAERGCFVMDYEDFEQKIIANNVRMYLLCNPHNPGGRVWRKDELEKITRICLKHNVLIISDEIHCDLTFFGNTYTSVLHLPEETARRSIVCKSTSKTFNLAGLHIAHTIIKDRELRRQFCKTLKRYAASDANSFAVESVKGAYLESDDWYEQMLRYIEQNIVFASEYIDTHLPRLYMPKQEGTYLGFIDARGLGLAPEELEKLCEVEAKIALDYGHWFGKEGEGFLRINLACPRSLVKEALDRLQKAIESLVTL